MCASMLKRCVCETVMLLVTYFNSISIPCVTRCAIFAAVDFTPLLIASMAARLGDE